MVLAAGGVSPMFRRFIAAKRTGWAWIPHNHIHYVVARTLRRCTILIGAEDTRPAPFQQSQGEREDLEVPPHDKRIVVTERRRLSKNNNNLGRKNGS